MQPKNPKRYAERLWNAMSAAGFGALGKRDLELLMFYLLEQDGAVKRTDEAHHVATQLRTTAARVHALRRDAYARWSVLDESGGTREKVNMLNRVFTPEAIRAGARFRDAHDLKPTVIPVRVSHAADREMLEGLLAEIGAMPDYRQNRNILLIPAEDLVDIADHVGLRHADPQQTKQRLLQLLPVGVRIGDILTGKREDNPTDIAKAFVKSRGEELLRQPGKFIDTLFRLTEAALGS